MLLNEAVITPKIAINLKKMQFLGTNYALNKPANQSSTHSENFASLAVDGNRTTFSHTEHPNDTGDEVGEWYVDMEDDVVVAEIVVYLRTNKDYEGVYLSKISVNIFIRI